MTANKTVRECPHKFIYNRKVLNGGYLGRCVNPTCRAEFFAPIDEYEFLSTTTKGEKVFRLKDKPDGYGR